MLFGSFFKRLWCSGWNIWLFCEGGFEDHACWYIFLWCKKMKRTEHVGSPRFPGLFSVSNGHWRYTYIHMSHMHISRLYSTYILYIMYACIHHNPLLLNHHLLMAFVWKLNVTIQNYSGCSVRNLTTKASAGNKKAKVEISKEEHVDSCLHQLVFEAPQGNGRSHISTLFMLLWLCCMVSAKLCNFTTGCICNYLITFHMICTEYANISGLYSSTLGAQ